MTSKEEKFMKKCKDLSFLDNARSITKLLLMDEQEVKFYADITNGERSKNYKIIELGSTPHCALYSNKDGINRCCRGKGSENAMLWKDLKSKQKSKKGVSINKWKYKELERLDVEGGARQFFRPGLVREVDNFEEFWDAWKDLINDMTVKFFKERGKDEEAKLKLCEDLKDYRDSEEYGSLIHLLRTILNWFIREGLVDAGLVKEEFFLVFYVFRDETIVVEKEYFEPFLCAFPGIPLRTESVYLSIIEGKEYRIYLEDAFRDLCKELEGVIHGDLYKRNLTFSYRKGVFKVNLIDWEGSKKVDKNKPNEVMEQNMLLLRLFAQRAGEWSGDHISDTIREIYTYTVRSKVRIIAKDLGNYWALFLLLVGTERHLHNSEAAGLHSDEQDRKEIKEKLQKLEREICGKLKSLWKRRFGGLKCEDGDKNEWNYNFRLVKKKIQGDKYKKDSPFEDREARESYLPYFWMSDISNFSAFLDGLTKEVHNAKRKSDMLRIARNRIMRIPLH